MNMITQDRATKNNYALQAEIFKVLTHPARLAILEILRDGEHCVCHLEAWLGFRQAYISQQLSMLRQAELIRDRRDGWNIYYRVADERIYDVIDQVSLMTGQEEPAEREPVTKCNCPKCSNIFKK